MTHFGGKPLPPLSPSPSSYFRVSVSLSDRCSDVTGLKMCMLLVSAVREGCEGD